MVGTRPTPSARRSRRTARSSATVRTICIGRTAPLREGCCERQATRRNGRVSAARARRAGELDVPTAGQRLRGFRLSGGSPSRRSTPPDSMPRVAATRASNNSSSSGARSATAARWRCTVSVSPRATGPVSAATPPRAQLSSAARASGSRTSGGWPAVAMSRAAAASTVIRKLAAIDAAAWYAARSSSAISIGRRPTASASARATASARGLVPAIAAGTPPNRAPAAVTVISGCRLNASRSPSASSRVAPEQWPTSGPGRTASAACAIAPSGTQSRTTSAPAPSYPRPCGPVTARPIAAQGVGERRAQPAGTDDGDRADAGRGHRRRISIGVVSGDLVLRRVCGGTGVRIQRWPGGG